MEAIICGGASVCWFSRIQKGVTISISEAEYAALGDAVNELLHSFGLVFLFFSFFQFREEIRQM